MKNALSTIVVLLSGASSAACSSGADADAAATAESALATKKTPKDAGTDAVATIDAAPEACVPTRIACDGLYHCGPAPDGCGGSVHCGSCPADGICATQTQALIGTTSRCCAGAGDTCAGKACGTATNECGMTFSCGVGGDVPPDAICVDNQLVYPDVDPCGRIRCRPGSICVAGACVSRF